MYCFTMSRNSRPEVFLRNGVLKICSKITEEHPCRSVISIKLQGNLIEIGILLNISCIFSERLFLRTPLDGCLCTSEIVPNLMAIKCPNLMKRRVTNELEVLKSYS